MVSRARANAKHIAMSWRAPNAEEENGDGSALAGRRVRVEGFGDGTVLAFSRCAGKRCMAFHAFIESKYIYCADLPVQPVQK